jgi:superfamily I DNA and/or RNA helicase
LVSNKAGEIDKPIGRERRMIIDLLNEYRYEYDGIIELTPEIDPSANWETGREWKIVKIDETRLEVTLEREKIKRNKELASEGLIRPSEMSRSLSLYKRKKYIIEDIKDNHILLSALLHPKINSFYLGIENDNDNKVINDILNTIPLFLVQGPPGCGKTWVASTIVAKILQRDPFARILLSAKDHQPLDHLLKEVIEKIPNNIEPKPIIIRTISTDREKGYKEKALALKYSGHVQTVQMFQHAKNRVSHELPREIQNSWIKIIDENIKEPQLKWMDEVLKSANIVFTTSTSSSVDWLRKNASSFDYIIIEEAAKSYPLELLLPMNLGYRWLLIGDQKQLPPYKYNDMKSEVIEYFDKELEPQFENIDEMTKVRTQCIEEIKFFEYIYNKLVITDVLFSDKIYHPCFRLETNWRFPPVISDMISSIFYNTKFITKKPPTKINDPFTEPDYLTNNELIWIDTPKAHEDPTFLESKDQVGSSFNEGEIKLLINFLQKLKVSPEINVKDLEIVIITPYKTQQELIINKLNDYTETNINCKDIAQNVYTVDSYQGEQADIIIISLVRNNEFTSDVQALGFLTFLERINVMFSRVKKRMIIIGCAKFIKDFSGPDSLEIKQVLNYVENNGIVIPYKNLRL